MSTFWDTW